MKRLHAIKYKILPLRGRYYYAKVESGIFLDSKKILLKHDYLGNPRDIIIDNLEKDGFNILGYLDDDTIITDTVKTINNYK
jgi:hypothetical protein